MFFPNDPSKNNTEWYVSGEPKALLGKGIIGQIRYSPDGTQLAVGSSIGVWIYNAHTGKELNLLTGHTEWPKCIAYSPDGNMLASGGGILASGSYKICLWDPNTGEHKATLGEHESFVPCLEFSPDGSLLASGSVDETIQLWDVTTGKHKATLIGYTGWDHWAELMVFSPSPNSYMLTSATKGEIRLWDTKTGQHKATLTTNKRCTINAIAFSPDNSTIAGAYYSDNTVRLWDTSTGERKTTLTKHTDSVLTVAYSPDGLCFISGSEDDTILLWDTATYQLKVSLTGDPAAIAFSPDSKTLAIGSRDKKIKLWDAVRGEHKTTLTEHTDDVYNLIFNPVDGRTFAGIGGDSTIRLWDTVTGEHLKTITGHTRTISSISFNADGSKLATGSGHKEGTSGDNIIRIYNVHSGKIQNTFKVSMGRGMPIDFVSYSPDGKTLASGDGHGTIRLWGVESGKPQLITFEDLTDSAANLEYCDGLIHPKMEEQLRAAVREAEAYHKYYDGVKLAYSPDGKTLASIRSRYTDSVIVDTIQLRDAATCKHKVTLTGPLRSLISIAFSPDSRTIAGGSDNGKVYLWDAISGKLKTTLIDHEKGFVYSIAFSPDGRTLASAAGEVCLWDTVSGKCKTTLSTGWVTSVAFSPDGSILAVGGGDNVTLWDVRKILYQSDNDKDVWAKATAYFDVTGRQKAYLEGHIGFVSSVAFSPDGHTLASGGKDGTVLLWNTTKIPPTPQQIAQHALGSTVVVKINKRGYVHAEGNGFFVEKGLVATYTHLCDYWTLQNVNIRNSFGRLINNISKYSTFWNVIAKNHVIKEANVSSLKLKDNSGRYPIEIEGIAAIDGRLAILKVSDSDVQPLSLSNDDVQIGDTVYVASNPGQLSNDSGRFLQSTVSSLFTSYSGDRTSAFSAFEITNPIPSGCNGCPVLNSKGQVIGMGVTTIGTWGTWPYRQIRYYAIPSYYIKELLSKAEESN